MKASLLLVEDHRALSLAISALAERCGFEVAAVPTLARAEELVVKKRFDVVLLDIGLPDGHGLELLKRGLFEKKPVVAVVSAHGEIDNAIAARKLGVTEFFDKPVDFEELEGFLRKHCRHSDANETKDGNEIRNAATPFIGASKVMRPVLQQIAKACAGRLPVVVSGATGTGRSHVAELIQSHAETRAGGKVVMQATAGMTSSELDPILKQAEGGLLVIEDLVLLSRESQSGLLSRMDGLESAGTRFIVTADEGGLREGVLVEKLLPELYYRFQVLEISLPSLRDRVEDIPALVSYFIGEQDPGGRSVISDELEAILQRYDWPGNLRELRNVVSYLLVAGAGRQELTPADLPLSFLEGAPPNGKPGDSLDRHLAEWVEKAFEKPSLSYRELHDQLEGRLLGILLERFENKPSHLAEALAMNRVTLRKKLKNREERNAT